jgi:hypothetical protein
LGDSSEEISILIKGVAVRYIIGLSLILIKGGSKVYTRIIINIINFIFSFYVNFLRILKGEFQQELELCPGDIVGETGLFTRMVSFILLIFNFWYSNEFNNNHNNNNHNS